MSNAAHQKESGGDSGNDPVPVKLKASCSQKTKCTKCRQEFPSLAECLKHELIVHEAPNTFLPKRVHNLPKQIVRTIIEDAKSGTDRAAVKEALNSCDPGTELETVFKIYGVDCQTIAEVNKRIIAHIEADVRCIARLRAHPLGSTETGLALKGSDLDFNISEEDAENDTKGPFSSSTRYFFQKISTVLQRSLAFEEVFSVRQARVPIIKCKHKETGFNLDISINCHSSVKNTNFFRDIIHSDPKIYQLMLFLKIWAKRQKIIKPGNLSSYCFMTMVLFSLQQAGEDFEPVLPATDKLLDRKKPLLLNGINHAYDLSSLKTDIPNNVTVTTLMKRFFSFYADFNFPDLIISPNNGSPVPRANLLVGAFSFPAYEKLLRGLAAQFGTPVEKLQLDRCLIVQDVFSLNVNIAKHVTISFLEYFRTCICWSHQLCADERIVTDKELYYKLLYCVINQIENPITAPPQSEEQNAAALGIYFYKLPMKYEFASSRNEMQVFCALVKDRSNQTADRLWAFHYFHAVKEILTKIYKMKMEVPSPACLQVGSPVVSCELQKAWIITGNVDLWSGRMHQRKKNENFMTYHSLQSEEFLKNRAKDPKFQAPISALIIVSSRNNFSMEMIVKPYPNFTQLVTKKDPLRRFFSNLKTIVQNYNVKESLAAMEEDSFQYLLSDEACSLPTRVQEKQISSDAEATPVEESTTELVE